MATQHYVASRLNVSLSGIPAQGGRWQSSSMKQAWKQGLEISPSRCSRSSRKLDREIGNFWHDKREVQGWLQHCQTRFPTWPLSFLQAFLSAHILLEENTKHK